MGRDVLVDVCQADLLGLKCVVEEGGVCMSKSSLQIIHVSKKEVRRLRTHFWKVRKTITPTLWVPLVG